IRAAGQRPLRGVDAARVRRRRPAAARVLARAAQRHAGLAVAVPVARRLARAPARPRSMNTPARSAIKDAKYEAGVFRVRAIVGFVLIVACLCVLGTRFAYLQVQRYDDFSTRSDKNRISTRSIAPGRGLIYDRNGVLLADNTAAFRLEVVPEQVHDMNS